METATWTRAGDKDALKRPVRRTRSDSVPLPGSSAATETAGFAQGDTPQVSKWKSWSVLPHMRYGIPLGSLTAQEAAKSFWNKDMLQQRLEKIAEYASLEMLSLDDCTEMEGIGGLQDPTDAQAATSNNDTSAQGVADDGSQLVVGSAAVLHPTTELEWEAEQSACTQCIPKFDDFESSTTGDGILAVRSAPLLIQRQVEPCATAILSQSAHVL